GSTGPALGQAGGRRAGRPRGSVPSRGPAPSRSLPVEPKVRVAPVQSSSLPQTDRLACYVTGFYPAQIEVKWFQNGREETERVVSTDVIPNGDWTYQVLVMLETTPQRGDTYTCQVEHVSLQHPVSQRWDKALHGPWGGWGVARAPPALTPCSGLRRAAVRRRPQQDADGGARLRAGAHLPGTGAWPLHAQEGERGGGRWVGGPRGMSCPGASAPPLGRTVPRPGVHPLFSPQGS
uniref:Ig-like domain-containing protein n=1 Tax=Strix occidentalis caurina TaxID=311401 RepID=A0A8D0EZ04_STROC